MEDFDWNIQNECSLLESMIGHKPTGVNKFFQMLVIFDKFHEKVDKEIMGKVIWSHLETMYNLEALDESDLIPFPNSSIDFELPDCDFATLIEMKVEEMKNVQKGCEQQPAKNTKDSKRDDKTPTVCVSEVHQRRDSKDSRSSSSSRKESKSEKPQKSNKGRSTSVSKDETSKSVKLKAEERGRSAKRSTRGSLKPDDGNNSGKSSPVSLGSSGVKRRRI